jgi:ATP-binding cassette, subfamily C (CFTR/MRP), member 1
LFHFDSGKTSLIATLLRLIDINSGSITIDGIDINTIPRAVVRRRLNTIPQDAYFFSGTIRENLCIHNTNSSLPESSGPSDARIIAILTRVELWSKIATMPQGLDSELKAEHFSHGQRQLLCLVRAVLRGSSSKILILDEAMSSVDSKTAELMQRIVNEEFEGQTVLAVVHRLDVETMRAFDRVVVLDAGQVVDFDAPEKLMGRSELFRGLGIARRAKEGVCEG